MMWHFFSMCYVIIGSSEHKLLIDHNKNSQHAYNHTLTEIKLTIHTSLNLANLINLEI